MAIVFNGRCLTRPVGGVERYARMLLDLLADGPRPVRVVLPADAPEDRGIPASLTVERRGRMHGHAWEQLVLPRCVGPDDILLSPANTGPLRVRRQLVVVHDLAFLHHPELFDPRFARWYGFLLPRLVRRCSGVITVSGTMRTELKATFGLGADRVAVVPPFADPRPFRRAEPVPVPEGFVLLVGADDPRKEVGAALALLKEARPTAHAVVVGRQRRPFKRTDAPVDDRVTWLPDASDAQLAWLYDHAFALLHPSRYEGFGLPILEALQRGCPVVARPIPVVRELFGDAVHACAFAGSGDLAGALDRIPPDRPVHDPRMAAIVERFTRERTREALLAIMNSID